MYAFTVGLHLAVSLGPEGENDRVEDVEDVERGDAPLQGDERIHRSTQHHDIFHDVRIKPLYMHLDQLYAHVRRVPEREFASTLKGEKCSPLIPYPLN